MPFGAIPVIGGAAGVAAFGQDQQQQQIQQQELLANLLMHAQSVAAQREWNENYKQAQLASIDESRKQAAASRTSGLNLRALEQIPGGNVIPSQLAGTPEAQDVSTPQMTLPASQLTGFSKIQGPDQSSALTGPSGGGATTGETQVQAAPIQPTGNLVKIPSPQELERQATLAEARSRDAATQVQRDALNAATMRRLDQGDTRLDQGQQRLAITLGQGDKAADARLDRSYQFNATQLERLRKSYSDRTERLGRLQDSINQGTAAADALIGPELLSVAAGGQGSGLRMNEAEIARIVGGRSNWETLKAKFQMWNIDPKAARSLTTEQNAQIQKLVTAITKRNADGLAVLDQAGDDLVNAGSVQEHRSIVNEARKKLTETQTPTTPQPSGNDIRVGGTYNGKKILSVQPVP